MTPRTLILALHAAAVILGIGYLLVALALGSDDANIGAGLASLWLALCGLPWSLPLRRSSLDITGFTFASSVIALALLNLALHAMLGRWVSRRQ